MTASEAEAAARNAADIHAPHRARSPMSDDKTVWRVLKHDEKADPVFVGPVWVEVGELETEYSYGYITYAEQQQVGALAGPGDYLLISNNADRFIRLTLRAETVFELVEDTDDEPAGVVPFGGEAA